MGIATHKEFHKNNEFFLILEDYNTTGILGDPERFKSKFKVEKRIQSINLIMKLVEVENLLMLILEEAKEKDDRLTVRAPTYQHFSIIL